MKLLNGWMMTQYQHSFPKREFGFMKLNLEHFTKSKSSYRELIRLLSEVMNVFVLRDVVGDNRGFIYIIGRYRLAETYRNTLIAILTEIELLAKDEFEYVKVGNQGFNAKRKNPHTARAQERDKHIKQAMKDIEVIRGLKVDFYLDKFARIRKVRENETADTIFVKEYIKENRLTHLKRLRWQHM